ncbi:MAG TPA: type II toxin-antitoxin system death-on-curing family toxin [Candidatus Saccharimonadales bacterium]|nr:type II toxin-antitoxin system death-on-curing family toxin [Candidatus Saccharimonadales bacterium]
MTFKYLSLEEILRLHFQVIEDFGGSHGIRDEGRLESVAKAPPQSVFGKDQYPTIYGKAAVYLRNIIGDHPFTDGNKRTALTVCAILLRRHGHIINASPKDLEDFTVTVATDHLSIEEISAWLKANTEAK